MENKLPNPGTQILVRNFNDEGWSVRTFAGISKKSPFKYITFDKTSDEVEEWLQIKTPLNRDK